MQQLVRHVRESIFHVLFPPTCPLCETFIEERAELCSSCAERVHLLEGDFHSDKLDRVWFQKGISCLAYEGDVVRAICGLKYERRFDLLPFFERLLHQKLARFMRNHFKTSNVTGDTSRSFRGSPWEDGKSGLWQDPKPKCFEMVSQYDVIIPVPLHSKRLAKRGFNQSALLAKRVGKRLRIPVDVHSLQRSRLDSPQVGQLAKDRIAQVKGAFSVNAKRNQRLRDQRILLIDDVITTGATANECAKVLVNTGARTVDVLTIARSL